MRKNGNKRTFPIPFFTTQLSISKNEFRPINKKGNYRQEAGYECPRAGFPINLLVCWLVQKKF